MKSVSSQQGFTLVELLVGLVAAAAITYAALSLYVTQHKQLIVQDQIADVQGNVRAATELLATTIRMAGFNVPKGLPAIETHNTNPDTIVVNFDTAILEDIKLVQSMPDPFSELNCSGYDLTGLNDGDCIYIFDTGAQFGEFFLTSSVIYGTSRIEHSTMALSRAYLSGSQVMKMNRIRFFVDQSDSSSPNLMIQSLGSAPQVFSENIVNLDFRYYLASGAIVTQTANPEEIRMVEIDVAGRTASPDPEFFQNYRTRNFTLRVTLRNVALN